MGKNNVFNKCCLDNYISTCKRMKLELYLMPYIKINSKWSTDLHGRANTIKLLGRTVAVNLHDLGFGDEVIDITETARATTTK